MAEGKDLVLWQSRAILPLASLGKGFPSQLRGRRAGAAAHWQCLRTVPWEVLQHCCSGQDEHPAKFPANFAALHPSSFLG